MATAVLIPDNSNREIRRLWIASIVLMGILVSSVLILEMAQGSQILFLSMCAAPALAILTAVQLIRVAKISSVTPNRRAVFFGLFFIIGAAVFDVLCTVIISPDLDMEGNLYIRKMLDSGVSLSSVAIFFGVFQFSFVLLFSTTWVSFLRHLPLIIDSVRQSQPTSHLDFVKAATGGAHLTWRQWLVPFKPSEFPSIYHTFWIAAISLVLGLSLFRWYAAAEWLGFFDISDVARHCVILSGVFGSLIAYFVVLARLSRQPA